MIMKTTHGFTAFFFFASAIFFQTQVFGQLKWQKIFKAQNRISVIYFHDRNLGFIGVGVPSGTTLTPRIYRTSDGGMTWTVAISPHADGLGVNDIFLEDKVNGWAASDGNNGRVWKTTDGGESWNAIEQ